MKNKKIALTGLMMALVTVSTFIRIPIPLGYTNTMVHMGNVFCLLSGFILKPFWGGLAAGLGSFLFDLTDPLFAASAPFSLVFKFLMAFICGITADTKNKQPSLARLTLAASLGSLTYLVLHLFKGFAVNKYFLQLSLEVSTALLFKNFMVSLLNSLLSIVIFIFLAKLTQKNLVTKFDLL